MLSQQKESLPIDTLITKKIQQLMLDSYSNRNTILSSENYYIQHCIKKIAPIGFIARAVISASPHTLDYEVNGYRREHSIIEWFDAVLPNNKYWRIHGYALDNNSYLVNALINSISDPALKLTYLNQAVAAAAQNKHTTLVTQLIAQGASRDWAVYGYARGAHKKMVKQFIAEGANTYWACIGYAQAGQTDYLNRLIDSQQKTDQMTCRNYALCGYAISGLFDRVNELIIEGANASWAIFGYQYGEHYEQALQLLPVPTRYDYHYSELKMLASDQSTFLRKLLNDTEQAMAANASIKTGANQAAAIQAAQKFLTYKPSCGLASQEDHSKKTPFSFTLPPTNILTDRPACLFSQARAANPYKIKFNRVTSLATPELKRLFATLLEYVVYSEQNKVEKIITIHTPDLLLEVGTVKIPYVGTFYNVTPLQIALWTLDISMCEMLIPYLPPTEAAKQLAAIESQHEAFGWDTMNKRHGKHYDFEPLINAYEVCINEKFQSLTALHEQQLSCPVNVRLEIINAHFHEKNHFSNSLNNKAIIVSDIEKFRPQGKWDTRLLFPTENKDNVIFHDKYHTRYECHFSARTTNGYDIKDYTRSHSTTDTHPLTQDLVAIKQLNAARLARYADIKQRLLKASFINNDAMTTNASCQLI